MIYEYLIKDFWEPKIRETWFIEDSQQMVTIILAATQTKNRPIKS